MWIMTGEVGGEAGMVAEPDLTTPEGRNTWLREIRDQTQELPRSDRRAARREAVQPVYGTPSYGKMLFVAWALILVLLADLIWYSTSRSGPLR
jgi:hypothetical protein